MNPLSYFTGLVTGLFGGLMARPPRRRHHQY